MPTQARAFVEILGLEQFEARVGFLYEIDPSSRGVAHILEEVRASIDAKDWEGLIGYDADLDGKSFIHIGYMDANTGEYNLPERPEKPRSPLSQKEMHQGAVMADTPRAKALELAQRVGEVAMMLAMSHPIGTYAYVPTTDTHTLPESVRCDGGRGSAGFYLTVMFLGFDEKDRALLVLAGSFAEPCVRSKPHDYWIYLGHEPGAVRKGLFPDTVGDVVSREIHEASTQAYALFATSLKEIVAAFEAASAEIDKVTGAGLAALDKALKEEQIDN